MTVGGHGTGPGRRHVAQRRRLARGGVRITCRQGDYTPPADTSVQVQEKAFADHRRAEGEQVAERHYQQRVSIDLDDAQIRQLNEAAAGETMTTRKYVRKLIVDHLASLEEGGEGGDGT